MKGSSDHEEPDVDGLEPTVELLVRAKDGDEAAWLSIDQRYRDCLIRIAHGGIDGDLRRRLDTEDLVQSTLVAAFDGLKDFEYQGKGSFQSWLQRILTNRTKQRLRQHLSDCRDIRRHVDQATLEHALDVSSMGPGEAVVAAEEHMRLVDAIADLEANDRELVVASLLEGRSAASIAEERDVHVATVRRHVATAVAKLVKKLK